jgi:hypothetical protein
VSRFSRFPEYATTDQDKHFILALDEELEDNLIIILDGASYFRVSAVMDLAARESVGFVRFAAYRPHPESGRGVLKIA